MHTSLRLALLLALLLAGFSCSKSSPPSTAGPTVMEFTVVDALLGPAVQLESPAFSIRPPKDWTELDSSRVGPLGALLSAQLDSSFLLKPERVFLNPGTGSALFVSSWSTDSSRSWKQVEAGQRARLDELSGGRIIKHDSFVMAEQVCLQSLIQDSALVNFKLLLACGIQLDYLVPRAVYESQVELIESSLGSVNVPHTPSQH